MENRDTTCALDGNGQHAGHWSNRPPKITIDSLNMYLEITLRSQK
jgi:hypothetical protein